MAIAYFPSHDHADAIDVEFVTTSGSNLTLRLMVDSGFTGLSSFVLSQDLGNLSVMPAPATNLVGAIQGVQQRVMVVYRMPVRSYYTVAVAVLSDLKPLALPAGIDGIVGLQFLRQFRRWGAEKMDDGSRRFYLET